MEYGFRQPDQNRQSMISAGLRPYKADRRGFCGRRAQRTYARKEERPVQRMQTTYVLGANVLLQAPYALESFEDNRSVLPLAVLEKLDDRKGADGEAGNTARHVLRF